MTFQISLKRNLPTLLLSLVFFLTLQSQTPPVFEETDGLVVIEAESAVNYFNWMSETAIADFSGNSYLHYRGFDAFNNPGNSKMTYQISISTPGRYRFQWRSRIAQGASNTDFNDSWLRFPDAAQFYAEKNNVRIFPHGSGMTPNPNGSGSGNWFKVYQNVLNSWTWNTTTSDNDPHNIFVEFDAAGIYTLEISGRSTGHAIDRIVLFHSSVNVGNALSLQQPESTILNSVATRNLKITPLKTFPNPVSDFISINLPDNLEQEFYEISIFDINGKVVYSREEFLSNQSEIKISTLNLFSGLYMIQILGSDRKFTNRFYKQ